MTWGPFKTEEGGKIISCFVKDELLPLIKEIRNIAVKTSRLRVGFWESFRRKELSNLEERYKSISVKFLENYHKFSTPDILFKDLKNQESPTFIADYFQTQGAVMQHFNEGFRLLSYIDNILTGQSTAAYNRASIFLSLLAIVIAVIIGILSL